MNGRWREGDAPGELTAINDHQFLLIERDSGGDTVAAPNYPFSNGRSRSQSADRTRPRRTDDDELILVRPRTPLALDGRTLDPPG